MSKKIVFKFSLPKNKTRSHYVLFCSDTPFKQKVVQSKVKYNRKKKWDDT